MTEMTETAIHENDSQVSGEKYIIFPILGRQYAIPSRFTGEIALFEAVYPLPLVPAYVLGVINRYSIPYALFDIGQMLFNTPSLRNKVLVLKDEIDRIAFLIDDVNGIADVPQENLLEVEHRAESGDMSEAVSATFSWGDGDVFILDIQYILTRISAEAIQGAW
jgi:purine-binding chemotaxis protein CheW